MTPGHEEHVVHRVKGVRAAARLNRHHGGSDFFPRNIHRCIIRTLTVSSAFISRLTYENTSVIR